jgi:arylsulfatase A-like enzyme
MNRPNIVFLNSHDSGRYVQPYGYAIPTPNIQRLAEEGVLFRQAYCANPTCSPSRASLLTGQWPHSCRMMGLVNLGWTLPEPAHLLPHVLRNAGYQTIRAGIQHVVADENVGGYDRILPTLPPPGHGHLTTGNDVFEDLAATFLAERHRRPFFLDVGFREAHRLSRGFHGLPDGERGTDPRYIRPAAPFPDTPETREDMAAYIDSARVLDRRIGRILDALDANGLRNDTLVICTTDHGICFPAMKCNLVDAGIGVMLVVRGPGGFEGGAVLDALVSQIDLFPTLCKLLALEPPAWLQGRSLMPLVRGEAAQVRDDLFAELNYNACYEPTRAARTRRWKYIRRFSDLDRTVPANCGPSLTKDLWVQSGWPQYELAREQLYDLVFDPHEAHNLAGAPRFNGALDEMRTRLDRWQRETDDPILAGPIAPSEEAVVVDPSSLSPDPEFHSARQYLGIGTS